MFRASSAVCTKVERVLASFDGDTRRVLKWALLGVVGAALARRVYLDCIETRNQPVTMPHYPVIGGLIHLVQQQPRAHDFLSEGINDPCNPNLFRRFMVMTRSIVAVAHPRDVEHLLKTNWKNYTATGGLRGNIMLDLFGRGIFNSDGDHWFLQRKMSSREFTANRFRFVMTKVFQSTTQTLCDVLKEACAAASGGAARVDMQKLFYDFTMDSFGLLAFGTELNCLRGGDRVGFGRAFDGAQQAVALRMSVYPGPIWNVMKFLNVGNERQLRADLKVVHSFVDSLIDQRVARLRADPGLLREDRDELEEDLLMRFVRLVVVPEPPSGTVGSVSTAPIAPADVSVLDARNSPARKLLKDLVLNFIIAGRDTTAVALSWLLYELVQRPDVERRVLREISAATRGGRRQANFDNVMDCAYVQAVISESQRLHPSVPYDPKTAVADDVLPQCGVKVAAGTTVAYVNYAMGRSEKIWGPDALVFNPERWLDADGKYVKADPFKFPAFQAGPRVCLGQDMSNMQVKMALAMVLPRFKFSLAKDAPPVTYRVTVVLQMLNGLWMEVSERA